MTLPVWMERFAEVYNNKEDYPTIADVALELGFSYQTVRNKGAIIRGLARRGEAVPELISRVITKTQGDDQQLSARDHAKKRADALRDAVSATLTSSRYPVINPEVVIVESFVSTIYDRLSGISAEKEGTPRTWLSDTLRVEGIEDPRGRTFLFTSAQNDAEVDEAFWTSLKTYAELMDADIIVGPLTYETQWWSESNPQSRSYDPRLEEFLCFGQMEIGDDFVFCGEMNTLPTARRPISDLTTYSRGRWAVFPHPMVQLKSVPSTDPKVQAHQVMTTGSVTRPKIIPRKAGVKSLFHQALGATIVEFDEEGDVFCRQIIADEDGSFYDLDIFVSGEDFSFHNGVAGIVFGDLHIAKADPKNCRASFGLEPLEPHKARAPGSMLEVLKPAEIFLHDIHDNEFRNHHHIHDAAHSFEMAYRGRDSVEEEVFWSADFLWGLTNVYHGQVNVVDSNHDLALERYVREGRYRNDGINLTYGLKLETAYMQYRKHVADALDAGVASGSFSLLEWAVRDALSPVVLPVAWVHDGQSYLLNEVEHGNHGFRGANGARGTVAGFAALGRPMSIADKHSPEILDMVYVAGTQQLHMGYNRGPSGWAVTNIVQYPNGKRSLVTLQNGKWRGRK